MAWPSKRPILLSSLIFFSSIGCVGQSLKNTPKFTTKSISLEGKKLSVEIADTEKKVAYGLMYRTAPLKNNNGMLFVFKNEEVRSFWMKNTFIPLSIGFFDKKKRLIKVHEMTPVRSEMETPKTYPSGGPAMYALEMRPKWFKENKIKIGSTFKF